MAGTMARKQPKQSGPEFMTVEEVADRLRSPLRTVRSWIVAGRLTGYRFGAKRYMVHREDLERFIRASVV